MYRVIDRKSGMFIRDDFSYNEETEIGLEVTPAQGFYHPKWDGERWIEGGVAPEPTPQPPTAEERLEALEMALLEVVLNG